MWRTSLGIRTLRGAEARLVRAAAARMYDQLQDCRESTPCGAPAFDRLSPDEQAFAVLAVVQRLTGDFPPLWPEAWADGAVFALFELVHREIAFEIERSDETDGSPAHTWRRLVRGALAEACTDDPGSLPAVDSTDCREWDFSVVSLAGRVLENHDFLDEDRYDAYGAPADYFVARPPDWTLPERCALLDFLADMVNELDRCAA